VIDFLGWPKDSDARSKVDTPQACVSFRAKKRRKESGSLSLFPHVVSDELHDVVKQFGLEVAMSLSVQADLGLGPTARRPYWAWSLHRALAVRWDRVGTQQVQALSSKGGGHFFPRF
jgi:hypothetical protein